MAIQAPSDDRQTMVWPDTEPSELAARTVRHLAARGDHVWVGGMRTGAVQRKAREMIHAQCPELVASPLPRLEDGQRVTVWSIDDPTYGGAETGRMIAWWGEGPRAS